MSKSGDFDLSALEVNEVEMLHSRYMHTVLSYIKKIFGLNYVKKDKSECFLESTESIEHLTKSVLSLQLFDVNKGFGCFVVVLYTAFFLYGFRW